MTSETVTLIGIILGLYLGSLWIWPWTTCRGCKGKRTYHSPFKKNWRDCHACGGSGKQVRLGRRVLFRDDKGK